jgi:hypothetical protein
MDKLEKIPGITLSELESLRRQGICTVTALWSRVGADFDKGLDAIAAQAGIDKERLVVLLKGQVLKESDSQENWLSRNWLELSLVAILLLVFGLYLYARSTGALAWVARPLGWRPAATTQLVYTYKDIPAYHLLKEADLIERPGPATPGAFSARYEVVGRFTLEKIDSGEVLLSRQLSQPVVDRRLPYIVLSIPVAEHMVSLVSPGQPVSFFLAPRDPEATCEHQDTWFDGIVLKTQVDEDGASLLVAIPEKDLYALRACMGFSDLIVARKEE